MTNSILYVTDTHSLLWHLIDSPKLGPTAREAFDQVGRGEAELVVPVIVLAELVYLTEKGRLPVDLDTLIKRLDENPMLQIVPLSKQVVMEMRSTTNVSNARSPNRL